MDFIQFLDDNMLWLVGGLIAIIVTVSSSLTAIYNTSKRERSRREIAAYIAEGSMTPEQGERIMNAGNTDD